MFSCSFDYFHGPAALQTDHECSKDDPQGQCSSYAVLADVLLSRRYSCCRWKINRNNKHPLVSNGNHNVMFYVLLITRCICDATAKRKMWCCSAVFHGHNYRHFVYDDSDLVLFKKNQKKKNNQTFITNLSCTGGEHKVSISQANNLIIYNINMRERENVNVCTKTFAYMQKTCWTGQWALLVLTQLYLDVCICLLAGCTVLQFNTIYSDSCHVTIMRSELVRAP